MAEYKGSRINASTDDPRPQKVEDEATRIDQLAAEYDIAPEDIIVVDINTRKAFDEFDQNIKRDVERDRKRSERIKARARRRLNQRIVDRALPEDKEYTINSDLPGFGLRIRPTGQKRYVMVYKARKGRFRRYTIGDAASMKFDEAYNRALELRGRIRDGEDPQNDRRQQQDFTLNAFFLCYVTDYVRSSLSPAWAKETERLFSKFAANKLGEYSVVDLTRRDLISCAEKGSTQHVRHKIRAVLSSLYSWGTQMGYVDENILAGSKRFDRPKSRDRVLDDRELAAVWVASFELNDPWGAFCRFMILTGQRRSEVAALHWKEIDLETREWVLPPKRMKNRQSHTVPLTNIMLEFLHSLENQNGFVFESPRVSGRPVCGFSKAVERWKSEAGFHDWRMHDLRRTVASNMGKIGVLPHVIEAVIAHKTGVISGIAAVYNRHKYEDEKRQALGQWNEYLMEIVSREYEPFVSPDDGIVL